MKTAASISVIVPAHNEEKRLDHCLRALTRQNTDTPYEIIVSDNASTDTTATIARKYNTVVVTEKQKNLVLALRKGIQVASGTILLITDTDSHVPPEWIKTYEQYFLDHPEIIAASGPFVYTDESPIMHTVTKLCNAIYPKILVRTLIGVNMGFRRSAYDMLGGFDPAIQLQWDSYFGLRLKRIGKIGFIRMRPVVSSGRRYTGFSDTISDGALRFANYLHLRFFDKPLQTHFTDIR